MVAPAKAVFRPSGFFLNLSLMRANGLWKTCVWTFGPDESPYMGKEEVVKGKTDEDERNLQ